MGKPSVLYLNKLCEENEMEKIPCDKCQYATGGPGQCPICEGMRYITIGGEQVPCRECDASGDCPRCEGLGYLIRD